MYNNIAGTAFVKCISLILNIYSIIAYSHYFNGNNAIYGLWLTIISILGWVVNFDLGIGNGLRNYLVRYITVGDVEKQKICISSAYILLISVSAMITIAFCVVAQLLDWNTILNVRPTVVANNTLVLAIQIAFVGLILQFVMKLVVSILYAMKETTIGSLITMSANFLIILFTLFFRSPDTGQGLIQISIAYSISVVLPLIITTIVVFSTRMKYARPSFSHYNHKYAVDILSLGGKFFGVQLLLLIINSTDSIIITQISGPEAVVPYTIYFQLFSAAIALFSVIINPVWSSVSERFYMKDFAGILIRKSIINRLAIIFSIGCITIVPIFQSFIDLFYGKGKLIVNVWYSLAFALFSCVMIFISSISCIENGVNDLTPQIVGNSFAAVLKFPLIICFAYFVSHDWIWVVATNGVILLVSYFVQYLGLRRKLNVLRIEFP